MRIADILAKHARPGLMVVDLTSPSAAEELSEPTWLPPDFGVTYTREPAENPPSPALVLHDLPLRGAEDDRVPAIDLGDVAPGVVHIVFFDRVETLVNQGVLAHAVEKGWELVGTHVTQNKVFRYAVALGTASETTPARLRLVNEYRYQKLVLRAREEEIAKKAELHRDLSADHERIVGERDAAREELVAARSENRALRERLARIERRLKTTRARLEAARRSISFRVGRATRLALRESRTMPLAFPGRWLAVFRGTDDVLAATLGDED